MNDFGRLSINQWTTVEKWSLREAVEGYARQGIHGIAVLRDHLTAVGLNQSAEILRDHEMTVSGYCIGGLLTDQDETSFQKAIDDNLRVIDEAAAIGAQCITFVAGGLPTGSKDIGAARARCLEGLAQILPHARAAGVTIGLEPLHPMTCAFRSCLTTLGEANEWCEQLGAGPELGVVVDVYHVWWDPELEQQIQRAKGRIAAFHISDWLLDTVDLRLDRGMMGDGVIDIPQIRHMVESAGYDGLIEVEIFSARNWWKRAPDEVVQTVKERYREYV